MIHVYKIIDITTNETIYVGRTKHDIQIRFAQHKADIDFIEKYEYLQKNPCRIQTLEDVCPEYGADTEQKYIDQYEPRFNRINALYSKFDAQARAVKRCKDIIKNLNK